MKLLLKHLFFLAIFMAIIPKSHAQKGRTQLLGPWKCRSVATKNKWVNGGYSPRVNDLFGPFDWTDSAIAANSALGEMDWDFETDFLIPSKKFRHYLVHLGQTSVSYTLRINNLAVLCDHYLWAGVPSYCSYNHYLDPSLIKPGKNTFRIKYFSPFDPERKAQKYDSLFGRIRDNDTSGLISQLRKPPYEGGWDIAPRRITAGLTEGISLEGWNHCRLEHFSIQTISANADSAKLMLFLAFQSDTATKVDIVLYLHGAALYEINNWPLAYGESHYKKIITIAKPHLWWPNGFYQQAGDSVPYLYKATLYVNGVEDTLEETLNFGIREIHLVREKDEFGESFYFKINNKPIFIKGVNLVPTRGFMDEAMHDSLWKSGQMHSLLCNANINMVRVWGGGEYEGDWFYNLCDKKGLLIWQDFMFAGCMYKYSYEQSLEVMHQTARLASHPCIALWCGNNEIDVAWKNWGWQKKYGIHGQDSLTMERENQLIFGKIIPDIVHEITPWTDYLPSSPVSNWGTRADLSTGDNHYWGVWHGEQPIEAYKTHIPRFCSEWGFPSYPMSGFKGAGIAAPDSAEMAILDRRLLSYKTAKLLRKYIDTFRMQYPAMPLADEYTVSLLLQSHAMQVGAEAYRFARPFCMGSLWWQFNDVWPGTTWSIVDFGGQPKPAYYTMRDVYRNLYIQINNDDPNFVSLKAANDGWGDSSLSIDIYLFGKQPELKKKFMCVAKRESVSTILKIPRPELDGLLQEESQKLYIYAYRGKNLVAAIRYAKNK